MKKDSKEEELAGNFLSWARIGNFECGTSEDGRSGDVHHLVAKTCTDSDAVVSSMLWNHLNYKVFTGNKV